MRVARLKSIHTPQDASAWLRSWTQCGIEMIDGPKQFLQDSGIIMHTVEQLLP